MNDQSRTSTQSITVDAPIEKVFSYFTVAEEMMRWWPTKVESDPRTGGHFKYTFENNPADAPVHVREGDYIEVVDNERLSYPWIIPGMEPATQVTVEFSADDAGTTVTVIHSGWPTEAEADEVFQMHDQGWAGFLQNLKNVLSGDEDIRPTAMDMKTNVPA